MELLKEKDRERLRVWVKKVLKDDMDKFDLNAEVDSTLNYIENKEQNRSKINPIMQKGPKESGA